MLSVIILSDIMLSVKILSDIMMSVIIYSGIIQSVVILTDIIMKNTYCLFQIKFITEYTNVQHIIITQI